MLWVLLFPTQRRHEKGAGAGGVCPIEIVLLYMRVGPALLDGVTMALPVSGSGSMVSGDVSRSVAALVPFSFIRSSN